MSLLKTIIKKVMGYKEIEFHVAGVTFKNGRKTRQALLKAIRYKDEPYDKGCTITFERYDFEGEPAIKVLANGEQVGNVPREQLDEFNKKWTSEYLIEYYKVIGKEPLGMIVRVLFK